MDAGVDIRFNCSGGTAGAAREGAALAGLDNGAAGGGTGSTLICVSGETGGFDPAPGSSIYDAIRTC